MSDGWVYTPPTAPWLDVLYEDDDVVVINKPGGLLSVPGRAPERQDSAFTRLLADRPTLRVVHRLDMDTSGVMLFALHRDAERALDAQFRSRTITKTYRARVWGHPRADQGIIDLPLARMRGAIRSQIDFSAGKVARTIYTTLRRRPDNQAELLLIPQTGRSHQLRVHLLHLGHPIVGDRFYALPPLPQITGQMMLHAAHLGFVQPSSGHPITVDAPLPDPWTAQSPAL